MVNICNYSKGGMYLETNKELGTSYNSGQYGYGIEYRNPVAY